MFKPDLNYIEKISENAIEEISNQKTNGLFLFLGRNGAGKTTLLNSFREIFKEKDEKEKIVYLHEDKEKDELKKTVKGSERIKFFDSLKKQINEKIKEEKDEFTFIDIKKYEKNIKYYESQNSLETNKTNLLELKKFGINSIRPNFKLKKEEYEFYELNDLIIHVKEIGEIKIEELPAGLKRLLLLYFENTNNKKSEKRIFVIDEIEKFLHPNFIKLICKILSNISKTERVFISTHSPLVIGELNNHFKNFYYVLSDQDDKITIKKIWNENSEIEYKNNYLIKEKEKSLDWLSVIKIMLQFPNMAEIFFAKKLILVEGACDKMILSNLFDSDCDLIAMNGTSWLTYTSFLIHLLKEIDYKKQIIENLLILVDYDQKNKQENKNDSKKLYNKFQDDIVYIGTNKNQKIESFYQENVCNLCWKEKKYLGEKKEEKKDNNTDKKNRIKLLNAFKFSDIFLNLKKDTCKNKDEKCIYSLNHELKQKNKLYELVANDDKDVEEKIKPFLKVFLEEEKSIK